MSDKAGPKAGPDGQPVRRRRPQPAVEPLVLRPNEAFRMLGIGRSLGFKLLEEGRLERVQLGPRAVGITLASVKRLAENRS